MLNSVVNFGAKLNILGLDKRTDQYEILNVLDYPGTENFRTEKKTSGTLTNFQDIQLKTRHHESSVEPFSDSSFPLNKSHSSKNGHTYQDIFDYVGTSKDEINIGGIVKPVVMDGEEKEKWPHFYIEFKQDVSSNTTEHSIPLAPQFVKKQDYIGAFKYHVLEAKKSEAFPDLKSVYKLAKDFLGLKEISK